MENKVVVIASLALNLVLLTFFAFGSLIRVPSLPAEPQQCRVDQVVRLHINPRDALLHATFNQQDNPDHVVVTMTQRTAAGFHRELGTFLAATDRVAKARHEAPEILSSSSLNR